jgi:hypothetical protein
MKILKSFLSITILFSSLLLIATGCKKNELNLNKNAVLSDGAFFKLGWFSPGLTSQGVQLKVNGARVSNLLGLGYTSTTQYAMPFPGGGLNTGGNNKSDYLNVTPGTVEVSLSIPKKGTNEDSVLILKTNLTLEKAISYTWIVADSFPSAKGYLLTDTVALADSGFIRLKFTNAMTNVGAGVDFLVSNTAGANQVLATNVDFQNAVGFMKVPFVTGTNTFAIRKTGTTTNLATYATSSLTNKRSYTVVARGYSGATSTRAPGISLIYNK